MHYYQCPYCLPSAKARTNLEWYEDDSEEDTTMYCPSCEEFFVATEEFLKEQKRKDKDG